jgi:hypothetical protein
MIVPMMTQQLEFSILSAPLAAIDRRTLSQAWYSALHLARTNAPPAPCGRAIASPAHQRSTRNAAAPRVLGKPAPPGKAVHASAERRRCAKTAVHDGTERRAPRCRLSREIEKFFLNPRPHGSRATFTVDRNGGRVHVVLQAAGERLCLIAVCAPALRERVARALSQARYSLAARGIAVALAPGDLPCS